MHPDSIQWNSSAPKSYRYIQSSGGSNALGRVKFIFPNKFSVFLHDTPSKSLFKKNFRARSSGCVRVQKPFELTSKILSVQDEKWTKTEIDTIVKRKVTERVYLNRKVNVYFLYWSVVFDENNKPHFLNDLYDLDKKVYSALTN